MPEIIREIGGRFVWGTPNLDEHGRLIRQSRCRACVHWQIAGWVRNTQTWAEGCALRYNEFPDRRECPDYCREPGSDDE